jgi:hypothetical protein
MVAGLALADHTALGSNDAVCGAGAQLALAMFAQMLLFAMAGMAIFLVPG